MAKAKKNKKKTITKRKLISITRFLFVTTQLFALGWVTLSYLIAAYATIILGQPYPVEVVSETVVKIIFGNGLLKVIENTFEHNNWKITGTSKNQKMEESLDGIEDGIE